MKKVLALTCMLVLLGVTIAWGASCVLSNAGRNMASNGYIGSSPGGLNSGTIEIQDVGNAVLATLSLPNPVGTSTNGVLTFGTIADATATGTGTADHAVIKNGAGTAIATVDVGTSGKTITISNASINAGDTVHVSSAITLTVPAGT